ncbi:MAG: glycosyl hydrolase [Flavobacteriales bacterium]
MKPSILVSVLLLQALLISAQSRYQNVMIMQQSGLNYPPCEPSISISKKDPSRMVAGAVLRYVSVSTDSGQTWKTKKMRSRHGVYGDPCIVSDANGRFHYFHLSDPTGLGWASPKILDRIVCQSSRRGGKGWTRGSSIGMNHPKDQDKEWVTYDPVNDQLIATWTQFDEYNNPSPECQSNILISVSKKGKTWSETATLSTLPGNCLDNSGTAEGVTTDVDGDGNIYAVWSIDGKLVMVIGFVDKATGQITGFSEERVIVDSLANWAFEIPGLGRANGMPIIKCDRSGGPNHGTLYVNWADQRNGAEDTDIWLIKSADQGKTWSDPIRINNDPPGRHQFFTWMDIDQTTGRLYFVFYDRRNHDDNQTDVYLAKTEDGGETIVNERISERPFDPAKSGFFGDYNNICVEQGVVRPIWARSDNGKKSIWTAIISD